MSVDKFGRHLTPKRGGVGLQGPHGRPGEGFRLTPEGNYDIRSKRLCFVGDPNHSEDAVNVAYLRDAIDKANLKFSKQLVNLQQELIKNLFAVERTLNDKIQQLRTDLDGYKELMTRSAELIRSVNTRVVTPHSSTLDVGKNDKP